MKKRSFVVVLLFLGISFSSCTNPTNANSDGQTEIITTNKINNNMQNLVSIIEIPTADLERAIAFYSSILGVDIDIAEMGDVRMGILPNENGTVNVVLANGSDYKPTTDGSTLYLNGGNDLQYILDKIEPNGGTVIVPKTEISPEMGFFALFIDTEGNKLGLHSSN